MRLLVLLLCAVLPFAGSRHAPHVLDDHLLRGPGSLVATPDVRLGTLLRADLFGTPEAPHAQSGYWRPVLVLLARAEWWLTGGAPRALAWLGHVVTILAHAGAVLALHAVLRRLLPAAAAWLAAALFAVHPVHVESVAWISGRSDPAATAFGCAGLALLLDREGGRARAALAVGAFALALLCKESALLIVALASAVLLRVGLGARRAALPWLAAAAVLAARALVFEPGIAPDAATGPEQPAVRWLSWLSTVPDLVRLTVWPAVTSPLRVVAPATGWDAPGVAAGAVALAALSLALGLAWRARSGALVLGLGAWLGTLALLAPWTRIVVGFPETAAPLFERYLYLAALAPALAVSVPLSRALGHRTLPVGAVVALLAVPIGVETARRSGVWSSDVALARAGLVTAPSSPSLWTHLGSAYLSRHLEGGDAEDLQRAYEASNRALALHPDHPQAAINAFLAASLLGRSDATARAERLLARHPEDPLVLRNVAEWHARHERWERAYDLLRAELETGRPLPGLEPLLEHVARRMAGPR